MLFSSSSLSAIRKQQLELDMEQQTGYDTYSCVNSLYSCKSALKNYSICDVSQMADSVSKLL